MLFQSGSTPKNALDMPTIKTQAGKVVTKGGLPSCTCCDDGTCDPDETTYCVDLAFLGGGNSTYTVVGSLNSGIFYYVDLDDTEPFLIWNESSLRWQVSDGIFGVISDPFSGGSTDRCDPVGSGYDASGAWTATVSLGACP